MRGAWYDLSVLADRNNVLELEATYAISSKFYATASYTNTFSVSNPSWSDASYGLTVGFNFGNGVTFGQRGYVALYPGD